ncbi:DUF298-domain-containing protein [Piedraia hortae CBS 480.64]|uniref:Defective in cullin neddylation protein n=1 Tax=Piedraia hortae CBS 480.64 TaxID=1314780 RepID=A0A6A7C6L9_9PEZI|nr:DUF298-domain-containing protein [Piedraia hortae CBS 480.64]
MPPAYTYQQKVALATFIELTGEKEKAVAVKALKQSNWSMEAAINYYYRRAAQKTGEQQANRNALNKLFDKYREDPKDTPNEINVEGTSRLLGDMGIALDEIGALVFMELVGAPSLGRLTREGFLAKPTKLGISTLAQMKSKVGDRVASLPKDQALFDSVYKHTFEIALAPGARMIPLEVATECWRLMFGPQGFEWKTANGTPWLDVWIDFLQDKHPRPVNRDLWKQLHVFVKATMEDDTLSFWSEESSWPSIIDEFVAHMQEKKSQEDAMDIE